VFTVLLRSFSAAVRGSVGPWSGHSGGMVATGTPFVLGASGVSQGYSRRQHGRNTDAARWQTEPVHRLSRSCPEAAPKLLRTRAGPSREQVRRGPEVSAGSSPQLAFNLLAAPRFPP